MKFEDVFLTEKQTILGPDRDVGAIPITRSRFILTHKNRDLINIYAPKTSQC